MGRDAFPRAEKVEGHCQYKTDRSNSVRRFSINADDQLKVILYKGKPRILYGGRRMWHVGGEQFHSNRIMGPAKARALIAWLASYVAMVEKQDPAIVTFVDSKASANRIKRNLDELARLFGVKNG